MSFFKIKEQISLSKAVDFGEVLNNSIDLFKKAWQQGFLFIVFYFLLSIVFVSLFLVPIISLTSASKFFIEDNLNGLSGFFAVFLIMFFLIAILGLITIVNGLLGGLYLIYKKADYNEDYSATDFFVLFSKDRIFKTFKIGICFFGIFFLGYVCCFFPVIYLSIPLGFFTVIYTFNQELTTSEIIKLSFDLGNKNWFIAFGLHIVCGLLSYVGLLFCGIGYFFTFAIVLIPNYFIYKNAIGFESNDEINLIGEEILSNL